MMGSLSAMSLRPSNTPHYTYAMNKPQCSVCNFLMHLPPWLSHIRAYTTRVYSVRLSLWSSRCRVAHRIVTAPWVIIVICYVLFVALYGFRTAWRMTFCCLCIYVFVYWWSKQSRPHTKLYTHIYCRWRPISYGNYIMQADSNHRFAYHIIRIFWGGRCWPRCDTAIACDYFAIKAFARCKYANSSTCRSQSITHTRPTRARLNCSKRHAMKWMTRRDVCSCRGSLAVHHVCLCGCHILIRVYYIYSYGVPNGCVFIVITFLSLGVYT